MRDSLFITALVVLLTLSGCDNQQETATDASATSSMRERYPDWYTPMEPFRVIGNIYYVGSKGLAMYFIPTSEGHIVIDGGLPEHATEIAANITALGFNVKDVKFLLNTHAHFDHSGGLAELKQLTGAKLIASEGDRSALEGGFYLGSEDVDSLKTPPVAVDQVIADGESLTLGEATLTAQITPGHTRGCTSWQLSVTENSANYQALVFCSASVALNKLAPTPQYDGIIEAYRHTFAKTQSWQPDVFLSNHTEFFNALEKREKQLAGDPLAFVNRNEFAAFMAAAAASFETTLSKQLSAGKH